MAKGLSPLLITPVCSLPIGAVGSCLRRFTVHFRRPPTLKQKNNWPYRGEYGFDWLRDEYIYPNETVIIDQTVNPPTILNAQAPLCKNPVTLKTEYENGVLNPITPYGQNYSPAWLSIFACGVTGNANSIIHEKGVWLTLQLDEIDEIVNDGTEIIFRPGKACLKVTPNKIPISSFQALTRKSRTLGAGGAIVNYYELVNAINIKCQGDTLDTHQEIKVIAKLGNTEVEVGKLMVYENSVVPKANIVVINVITPDAAGNKQIPSIHDSFEYLYKYQSFNQAMVRAEVRAGEAFDLVALAANPDVQTFFSNVNNPHFSPVGGLGSYITRTLRDLYQKYGAIKPAPNPLSPIPNPTIDQDGHSDTYLLFTCLNANRTTGTASLDHTTNTWGNIFVIFQSALKYDRTLVHEAGHTFSLTHTFEPHPSAIHKFHHGYTDNYMDYTWKGIALGVNSKGKTVVSKSSANQYDNKMYSFFKWQWDLIRKDRSVK